MRIPLSIHADLSVETKALIDTGAGEVFMDHRFAKEHKFPLRPLDTPIRVYNADGTRNEAGDIKRCAVLEIEAGHHRHIVRFLITSLGKEPIILGLPWLQRVNANIDFTKGTLDIDPARVNRTITEHLRAMWFPDQDPFTGRPKPVEEEPDEETDKEDEDATTEVPVTEPIYENIERVTLSDVHPEEEPDDQDLLIAYLRGEHEAMMTSHTTEWHGDMPRPGSPLTMEHDYEPTKIGPGPTIGRIRRAPQGLRFAIAANVWIRAKVNPAMALAQQQQAQEEKKTFEEMLPEPYREYAAIFEKKVSERFPPSRPWDLAIELKEDFTPKDFKRYQLTPKELEAEEEFIRENLRKGYIRPSNSPMASPFFFVGKKDGTLRPCQDYRYLNEGTVPNKYPLPLISELVDKLRGAKVFSKLDLRSGYNNVRIKDGDQWKAAFRTSKGLYEPMVMFFGLRNSPSAFQAMMNAIFADMIDEGWLVIYMDDILIFSADLEEHRKRTLRVLERLKEHDLYLKLEKCIFDASEVEYLGMIISENKIAMDPVKVKGILDWPEPTTVKDVRSFLGFGNFYRRFIDHFSEIARPLNALTKKDARWEWTTECQKAFDTLKQRFATAPVLQMPDVAKPFVVESDASQWATGAVLRQRDANGDLHPCAYLSEGFTEAERNYEIYDRELLGIIRALKAWRHYLEGSGHPVTILSDHKNLTYWRNPQRLNRRQARWALFLSQFDIQLVHTPGTAMVQSDALSRRPDHRQGAEDDNVERTMLPDNLFVRLVDTHLAPKFQHLANQDRLFCDALAAIHHNGPPPIRSALTDWQEKDGLIFYRDRCYVPADESLRRDLIQQHHDSPAAGHPGKFKTLELLRRSYWWPGMYTMVSRYVEGCATCQQHKPNTHPTTPPPQPIPADNVTRPFQNVTMDLITDLPESHGYDSVLVVVDHGLTKGVIFAPCKKTIDAIGTAALYHRHVYRRFGLPSKIISDRGPQFVSNVTRELGRLLGITLSPSTAYHPQTDGQTERVNQELEVYLRIFCEGRSDEWTEHLVDAEVAHNQRIHSARNASPFYLMMGYEPTLIPIAYPKTNAPTVQERLANLQKARDEALAAHELARHVMRDRFKGKFAQFKKGQKVWLEGKNLQLAYASRKLAPKREGPFVITEVLGPVTYRLELPKHWKVHPVFHACFLTPYKENDTHGPNYTRPPPDLINGEEEYEVEAIVGHKTTRGGIRYQIKWKGYSSAENTWEPESALIPNANEILQQYKKAKKLQ